MERIYEKYIFYNSTNLFIHISFAIVNTRNQKAMSTSAAKDCANETIVSFVFIWRCVVIADVIPILSSFIHKISSLLPIVQ